MLSIIDVDIIIDTENGLVTFQNMYVKLYYYYTKDTDISYLETTNNLTENPANKLTNNEIPMPFDYFEPERPAQ